MGERRALWLYGFFAVGAAFAAMTLIGWHANRASTAQQIESLTTVLDAQAHLIASVARFDQVYSHDDNPRGARAATLSQVWAALAETRTSGGIDLLIADPRAQAGKIALHRASRAGARFYDLELPSLEPVRRGLRGGDGAVEYRDEAGRMRLAVYRPIQELDVVLLATIPVAQLRAPLVRLLLLGGVVALLLAAALIYVAVRLALPALRRANIAVTSLNRAQAFANIGHWDWNIVSGELEWSDEIYRILGLQPQQFGATYDAFLERVHPEDRDAVVAVVNAAVAGSSNYDIEHRLVRPSGEVRLVHEQGEVTRDAAGRPLAMLGVVYDITDARQTSAALAASQARMVGVMANIADAVITIDAAGRIESFNPAATRIFGYAPEEAIGESVGILMADDEAAVHQAYVESYLRTGQSRRVGTGNRELAARRKDGSEFMMELAVTEMTIDGKIYFIGGMRDITARKAAEQEIRDLNEGLERRVEERTQALQSAHGQLQESFRELRLTQRQMVQQEKMASLGALVAGVAHEINTPVGIGVTAASHLEDLTRELAGAIEEGKLTKKKLTHFLDRLDRSTGMVLANLRRAAALISSFKQVAVDQSSEQQREIILDRYIDDVLTSLQPKFKGTKIAVTCDLEENIRANSYPGAISQLVTNLLINALQHGYDEGDTGTIRIRLSRAGQRVQLLVSDDGKGMPEQIRNTVFDPFVTTRAGAGGTGLGMHIVYNLVTQRLGGTIDCRSTLGEGTLFSLEFPKDAPADQAASAAA